MRNLCFLLMFCLSSTLKAQIPVTHPYFSWINQQQGTSRPDYAWEGVEDIIYHNTQIANPNWATAPEFYAFLSKNWVFNRAMKWVRTKDGNIFCYSECDTLKLTGKKQVSRWFSDPANIISEEGERTIFIKQSKNRVRDACVLPAFQFHLGQHPVLVVNVSKADCDWQFCVGIKGRAGKPMLASGWQNGAKTITFNIAGELRRKGYDLNYAELNLAMGVWTGDSLKTGQVEFSAFMKTQPAIITSLPVIKTLANASKGIPVEIILTNGSGEITRDKILSPSCSFDGRKQDMVLSDKTYKTVIPFFQSGNHQINFILNRNEEMNQKQTIRITGNEYFKYDKEIAAIKLNDSIISPLTGSYQGAFYFANAGKTDERMVQGQEEWNKSNPDELRLHWWESLTGKELEQRFSYLGANKWKVLHLNQHWNNWERLDAGGNISPHGAEQLALYVRSAHKFGLAHIQDLSHYPYYESTVWQQYKDAGYKETDWFILWRQPFTTMFHQYIHDVASIFKDETSILAIGASGEGDKYNQLSRSVDIMNTYQDIDSKHIFIGEPIHIYNQLPRKDINGWTQDILGSRTYLLGNQVETELDMGMYFKLNQMNSNVTMLEGSFAPPPGYSKMTFDPRDDKFNTWTGTEIYRTNLRTSIYMGLVARQSLLVTWDEQFTEDERLVFDQIRKQIRWDKKLKQPDVSILITDSLFKTDFLKTASKYERYFTTDFPVGYRFITDTTNCKGFVINIMNEFEIPQLPNSIRPFFKLSEDYAVTYTVTEDNSQIMAYIYNISNHIKKSVEYSYIHRLPNPVDLELSTPETGQNSKIQMYDLNDKKLIQTHTGSNFTATFKNTTHDYFLIINN
jgi:hypothetical protein